MRQLSIREALNEALAEEMERDETVFLMGEEVGHYNGAYKVSRGLLDRFGEERVIDTPIAENGFAGLGVGAAMVGLRPVIEFMTWNFSLSGIDQVINSAAKMRYMSGGQFKIPMVYRGPGGAVHQLAAQHSHSLESFYAHIPGLKVMMPATPYDAKGMLKTAIRDDDPVIFIESEAMYGVKGDVPEEEYLIPFGKAEKKHEGDAATIICWSKSVPKALKAANILSEEGINVDVIDLRSIRPLDYPMLEESLRKTNRVLVLQESWPLASVGHWIAADLSEKLFDFLDAPIKVLSGRDCPYPYSKTLESEMAPTPEDVVRTLKTLL